MTQEAVQLNWCGQPIREGEGYGGRPENIPIPEKRPLVVTETDLAAVFEDGSLSRAEAVKLLQAVTGTSRATCYRALDLRGRFAKLLKDENGMLAWRGELSQSHTF
jgi:hypothetical protein